VCVRAFKKYLAMKKCLALFAFVATAASASDSPLDLAYRADQASWRAPEAATGVQLPRLLDEYQPPPEPLRAEPQAKLKTSTPYAWNRVRAGFSLATLDGPLVARWQAWYLDRPQLLQAMFERSRRYVFYVVEELNKRGMPTELTLLPMVESGYNPKALSSAQASGLWQFIPSTGKEHDLEQGLLLDARRDIIASTAAALDYLKALHERFGDWALALAAYNAGEAAVTSAIARNKARGLPTNYSALPLPDETRNYLPKLQALKNIVADPGPLRAELERAPNTPYFATVASDRYLDVDVAARLAEIPLEEFIALNPGFKLNLVSKNPRTQIVLPVDKVDSFVNNLENYREPPKRGNGTGAVGGAPQGRAAP
jgi:membrane-bound lytic murein transglycosylase D